MPSTQKIDISVSRENGETIFNFQVPAEIERVMKSRSSEERQSESWPGLKFYYLPETETPRYKQLIADYSLFDSFGHAMTRREDSRFNMAWLRTVGGIGSVRIPKDLPFATVTTGMKNIVEFLKKFYEEFFHDFKVRGTVDIEM